MTKTREAFRTISEVSDWLETPAHVLRFWESKFAQIKPVKRAGGRRYYRPEDMALLGGIKTLLHEQGMTIKGVQKLLRDQGFRHVMALGPQGLPDLGPDLGPDSGSELGPDPGGALPGAKTGVEPAPVPAPVPAPIPAPAPGVDATRGVHRPTPPSAMRARLTEPASAGPALLAALSGKAPRSLSHRAARIGPLLARLAVVRDRMARA